MSITADAQFAPDSSLEGTGFEPSVPRHERNESHSGTGTVTEATKVRLEAVAYLFQVPMVRIHSPPAESRANQRFPSSGARILETRETNCVASVRRWMARDGPTLGLWLPF